MANDESSFTKDAVVIAMTNAFTLGWTLSELSCRLSIAERLLDSNNTVPIETATQILGSPAKTVRLWYSLFDQIVTLHSGRFPNSSTCNSLYEPPHDMPWPGAIAALYADPQNNASDAPPFANIGIAARQDNGNPLLATFKLYEATRRALNCIGLLYAHFCDVTDDALVWAIADQYQKALVAAVCEVVGSTPASGSGAPVAQAAPQNPTPGTNAPADSARKLLTVSATELLGAWSDFLAEQFRSGGTNPGDRQKVTDLAGEMWAYRAGQLLSSMSWEVSKANVVGEAHSSSAAPADVTALYQGWMASFQSDQVAKVQQAIAAMSAALDDAYYRVMDAPSAAQQTAGDVPDAYDVALPSNVCSAVSGSIGYWQDALVWLDPTRIPEKDRDGKTPPDHRLTPVMSTYLRQALVEQSMVWENLLTFRQGMAEMTVKTVMADWVQQTADGMLRDAVSELENAGKTGFRAVIKHFWPAIVVMLILVIPAAAWLWVVHPSVTSLNPNGIWALVGAAPVFAAMATWFSSTKTSSSSTAQPPASGRDNASNAKNHGGQRADSALAATFERMGALLSPVLPTLLRMADNAYDEIQNILAGKGHSIGIAGPLMQCFIAAKDEEAARQAKNSTQNAAQVGTATTGLIPQAVGDILNIEKFISDVIWSKVERDQEIRAIVRAAFGPLLILIHAPISGSAQAPQT